MPETAPEPEGFSVVSNKTTEDRFLKEIDQQHKLAIRTAEKLRKLLLMDTDSDRKTELKDFGKGTADPSLQILLMARDQLLEAEDANSKAVFMRLIRDVHEACDSKVMRVLDMAMKERHHQEVLKLKREMAEAASRSKAEKDLDAELEALAAETEND